MAIDLRSDTVTRPSPEMRQAMASAEVGDDMSAEDPTVNRLQERVAELLGKEAALFVPSGHMGNQLCLRAASQPGDAMISHVGAHVLHYETGTPCAISGIQPRVIDTPDGTFDIAQIEPLLLPRNIHHSRSRILELENTQNRCGGTVWDMPRFSRVCAFGKQQGLHVHLDGARLWNAAAASGTQPADWAAHADSLSVCFSKGLGAPVGSALAGTREFVEECRFYRKMFGGAMRQAGIIAAGALYALEHNRERIGDDHSNARLLAERIGAINGLSVVPVMSNIVMVDVVPTADGGPQFDAAALSVWLASGAEGQEQVRCHAIAPRRIRLVTHLDVTREQCEQAAASFAAGVSALSSVAVA